MDDFVFVENTKQSWTIRQQRGYLLLDSTKMTVIKVLKILLRSSEDLGRQIYGACLFERLQGKLFPQWNSDHTTLLFWIPTDLSDALCVTFNISLTKHLTFRNACKTAWTKRDLKCGSRSSFWISWTWRRIYFSDHRFSTFSILRNF